MIDVVGLDLSLTASGWARGDSAGVLKPAMRGPERLQHVRDNVMAIAAGADLAVLEAYAYLRAAAIAIPEVHGVVKLALYEAGIPIAIVPPAVLKKYTTGKGNADKGQMVAAAVRRFNLPADVDDDNAADAWLLKAMGEAAWSPNGHDNLPAYQVDMLTKVDWPAVVSA